MNGSALGPSREPDVAVAPGVQNVEDTTPRLQKENAQLRAEVERLSDLVCERTSWWRSPATIVVLTAILAALVPATTVFQGRVRKDRELALEELKFKSAISLEQQKQASALAVRRASQMDDLRSFYLERQKTPGEHLGTLRFVLATTDDSRLRKWAIEEKPLVETDLRKLEEQARQATEAKLEEPKIRPPVHATSKEPRAPKKELLAKGRDWDPMQLRLGAKMVARSGLFEQDF